MTEVEIAAEIIGMVPHWYQAEHGPYRYSLTVGEHQEHFYNHCQLTPLLERFLAQVQERMKQVQLHYFGTFPGLIDVLLESLAVEWLQIHDSRTDWKRVVKYLDELSRRTFENQPVALNLIIRPGEGSGDITQAQLQKVFDELASSPMTFLAVDPNFRLLNYGEVHWSQLKGDVSYKFYPETLHPIHSILGEGELSAHLTLQGDLVFMNRDGLMAARRKRKWKIYDVQTFQDSLAHCLGKYAVGASLIEIVFDLSFLRYGSLLIYDPLHVTRPHIRNKASIVFSGWKERLDSSPDPLTGQSLIGQFFEGLAMGDGLGSLKWKRRLIELARVDGAVIFDDQHVLAVGALIETHPCAGNQLGARTTAAYSAYLWGAHPIKISSDGDVTVYFKSRDCQAECDAELQFL